MRNVRAKNIVISVGASAPITSMSAAAVKKMIAKIKNHPLACSSWLSDLRLLRAKRKPVTRKSAIEINK